MGKSKKKKDKFGTSFVSVNPQFDQEDKPKKEKRTTDYSGQYDLEEMRREAENYRGFLEVITHYAILKNVPQDKYKSAVKKIKKLIKLLEEGRGEEVYDEERYRQYQEYKQGHYEEE